MSPTHVFFTFLVFTINVPCKTHMTVTLRRITTSRCVRFCLATMKAAVAGSTEGRRNVPLDGALSPSRSDPPAGRASPCGNLSRLTLLIALLMICLTTALPFGYLFAWSRPLGGASVPEGPGQRPEPPPLATLSRPSFANSWGAQPLPAPLTPREVVIPNADDPSDHSIVRSTHRGLATDAATGSDTGSGTADPPSPPPSPPPPSPSLEDGSGSGSGELGSGSGELGSGSGERGSGDDGSGELPLQPATLNERYGHNRSRCVTSLPLVSTSLVSPAADVPAGYVRMPEEVNQTHNGGTCAPLPAAETLTHNNLSTSQAYHIFPGALAPDVLSSSPYTSIGALLAYQ